MSKTRADYGSGIARPKIDDKDHFKLKGQFIKELRANTFSGSDHENANEHIEKVLEIVNLFHVPNITQDRIMLRVFPMSLTGAMSRWLRNKLSGSIKTYEDLKIKFISKYCPHARNVKKMKEINNFHQEPNETLYQAWERFKELLMKCPQHYLTKMHEVILFYNGLDVPTRQILDLKGVIPTKTAADANITQQSWKRIQEVNKKVYVAQVGCQQCKGPHYPKDCPLTKEEQYPMFESRQTTIPFPSLLNDYYCDEKKGSYGLQCLNAHSYGATRIDDSLPQKEKDPRSFTLPCYINNVCFENALTDLGASIDVFKRKITLRVGDEKFIFKSIKHASSLIKRVYMLSLRERMELDLEARLMKEILLLNRSLNPLYRDYIKLNDLNGPLELRRDQVDDLMPTIEEGDVFDKPMIDIIKTRNNESFNEYLSFCDFDRKIHIDGAYNLRFSCTIVVENMDGYRNQDIGDVIFREPLCKASCVEARRFDGLITIYNGNDNVTYRMARSHPSNYGILGKD
nr:hypothetical protein [Tanacetum cinerariifolium]